MSQNLSSAAVVIGALRVNILSVNFISVEGARQHICQNNFLVLTRYSVIFKTLKPNSCVIC